MFEYKWIPKNSTATRRRCEKVEVIPSIENLEDEYNRKKIGYCYLRNVLIDMDALKKEQNAVSYKYE